MSIKTTKKITTIDPVYVKNLAKLSFTDQELKQYATQLQDILKYVEGLERLSTKNLSPTYQTTGITNRFQNESVGKRTLNTQEALENASSQKNNLFQIKGMQYEK